MKSEMALLERDLAEMRLSKAELARRLGVHRQTVQKWGKLGVPRYATAYIDMLKEYRALREGLRRKVDELLPEM